MYIIVIERLIAVYLFIIKIFKKKKKIQFKNNNYILITFKNELIYTKCINPIQTPDFI